MTMAKSAIFMIGANIACSYGLFSCGFILEHDSAGAIVWQS